MQVINLTANPTGFWKILIKELNFKKQEEKKGGRTDRQGVLAPLKAMIIWVVE